MLSCCEMLLLFGQIQGRVTLKGLFVKEKRNEERKQSFCRLGQNLFLDLGKICPQRPLENNMKINHKFWYSGQRIAHIFTGATGGARVNFFYPV